jgi:hypothetical protein
MEARLLDIELPILGTGNNVRSPGLHLTDIIKDLMVVSGMDQGNQTWSSRPTMNTGFIWEQVLFDRWEEVLSPAFAKLMGRAFSWYHTGEIQYGGIYLTPDGIDISAGSWVLQEAKATWKSSKNNPVDNWRYMTQAKSYCMALGIDRVMFHILHLMGDYKGSGPIYKPWLITFLPHELDENWEMITNHAEYMRSKT